MLLPMFGDDVKLIRTCFELSVAQLADLIGASPSSIYRWEAAGSKIVEVEPFQLRLLTVMSKASPETAVDVRDGLVIGGGLLGLYRLLNACLPVH